MLLFSYRTEVRRPASESDTAAEKVGFNKETDRTVLGDRAVYFLTHRNHNTAQLCAWSLALANLINLSMCTFHNIGNIQNKDQIIKRKAPIKPCSRCTEKNKIYNYHLPPKHNF